MQYRYVVYFRHGLSVFANFSYGVAVLGASQCPPRTTIPTERQRKGPIIGIDVYAQQFYTAVYVDYNQERILSSLVTISVTTKFYLSKSHYQDLKCDCKLALRSLTRWEQYDPRLFTDKISYYCYFHLYCLSLWMNLWCHHANETTSSAVFELFTLVLFVSR